MAEDRFNPRPSQPEGATKAKALIHRSPAVSIHAPPNRKERPADSSVVRADGNVSIHAPPNRKERPPR